MLLLTFPDAATQRRALGRASMYLEDPEHRGRVAKALPAGARGGVANYSGHNARVRELVAFYNDARGDDGRGAWEDERAMMEALVDAGVVRKEKCGRVSVSAEWSRGRGRDEWGDGEPSTTRRDVVPEACVIAVCASGDAREVQDALLHEAMHGLWYARDDFARWCYDFYLGDALDDAERAAWVEFLRELRYDVSVEEIVVNEFQAYMATERVLFGPDACAAKSSSSKKSSGGRRRAVVRRMISWTRRISRRTRPGRRERARWPYTPETRSRRSPPRRRRSEVREGIRPTRRVRRRRARRRDKNRNTISQNRPSRTTDRASPRVTARLVPLSRPRSRTRR